MPAFVNRRKAGYPFGFRATHSSDKPAGNEKRRNQNRSEAKMVLSAVLISGLDNSKSERGGRAFVGTSFFSTRRNAIGGKSKLL